MFNFNFLDEIENLCSLKCSATGMQGFLRGDVLGYDLSDLPDASQEKIFISQE